MIVLPETDINGAIRQVERLRKKLRLREIKSQEKKAVVAASFGVTGFDPNAPEDKISSETMIKIADKYLYQAKQVGRDRIKKGEL